MYKVEGERRGKKRTMGWGFIELGHSKRGLAGHRGHRGGCKGKRTNSARLPFSVVNRGQSVIVPRFSTFQASRVPLSDISQSLADMLFLRSENFKDVEDQIISIRRPEFPSWSHRPIVDLLS